MPKYDPTARPKTKADKEKERREKEQTQVIKPSQRDPRHVTDPLAYGNRYDPVRDAQPVPDLNKKKPSVVDTLLSGIKGAASRAEKDPYSGYNTDDVTNANYNKGKKPESSGKKPERRTLSYMMSSGWTDEVKSYTPGKPEKPKEPTKSQQWAEDLSADAQRAEQREARKTETKKSVSPVDALVPKPGQTNTQDQTRLTDTATGNRSEWFPEMSAPEEKPVVPTAPSSYAGFVDDEDDGVDEVPGDTFPGTDIPMEEDRQAKTDRLREEQAKLREEYNELNNRFMWGKIGKDYTPEDVDRLAEMEQQIKDYDDQISALWEDVTLGDRIGNVLSGAAGQYGAGVTDAERALYEATQGMRDTQNAEYLEDAQHAYDRAVADYEAAKEMYANGEISKAELDEWERQMNEAQAKVGAFAGVGEAQRGATEATAQLADSMAAQAQQDLDNAKAGLSEFGQGAVDVFSNMTQMGMDAVTGLATGGGSLFSMGVRTFGSGTQEARQAGADLSDQMLYGLATTAIELGTEKLFGGDAGIYGPGGLDGMAEGVIARLAQSDTGMIALRVLANAHQEGLEEVVSGLLDPFAKGIYDDQAIQKWLDEGWPLEELMYEYIIGAACGAIFDTGSNLTPGGHAAALEQNEQTRSAYAAQQNAAQPADGLTAEDQRNEQRQQRQQTPDEILAEAATPKAEEERKTTGEERADEQTPEAPQEEAPIEEAPAEEETPSKEQPTPEEMGDKQQERKPETPAEILADEASKKGKAAEAPSEAAESTKGEDHESVPPSTQESPSEAQEELNNGSRSEEDAQQRKQERIAAADEQTRTEAEALRTEFEQDPVNVQRFQDGQGTYSQYDTQTRLSVLQYLFPNEDYYLSGGNIVKGRQTTASGNFNSTTGQSTTFGDRRTGSDFRRPKMRPAEENGVKPPNLIKPTEYAKQKQADIRNKQAADRKINHDTARKVEDAARILKEIEGFNSKTGYKSGRFENAEEAQAAYDEIVSVLAEQGLPSADELRQHAEELRSRAKEAQRMVDRIEANTPEGEDISDPDYNYWYDEVDAAEDEAYAVDAIADFVEAHSEVFTGEPPGVTMRTEKSEGGSEREQVDSGRDRSDSPVDGDAGTDAGDLREARKDDAGREGQVVGGKPSKNLESQADYDAAKDKRDQVNRRFDRGQATVESEIVLDGGEVIDIKYAPGWVKRAVEKAQKEAPDCRFVIATKTSSIAYYSHGNGVIVINPGRLANWALSITQKTGVPHSAANAVLHERVHYWLERSDYKATEILKYIQSDFANDLEAQIALEAAYNAHKTDYHSDIASNYSDVTEMQNALWEEVIADLAADLPRAFVKDGKINPAYERVKASAEKYVQNYVVPSYRINNGLDIYNGKPASGGPAAPSGPNDPGANKSWVDSLTAQEAPAENEGGERPDDDMTPLNEQSRERDEERREKQKAETKRKLGKDNYDRMNKALEKLDAWDKEYTERYGETAKDENGRDIVDDDLNETKTSAVHELATRVRSMLEGEESVQSFAEYYESLRPAEGETNQTDANYLYDGALAEMLNQLADAERALNLSEKGSPADGDVAREEFAKASEAFAGSLETRLGRLEEQFKNRTKANEEITSHAKGEKTGRKNSLDRLKKRFLETQMRVDTFFKMLGGFSEKSEVTNDLAQRGADSTIKRNNVRNSGYKFFRDLSTNPETAKAWKDIESGKTKGNVDIPGLGKASMNYELAMLKTLMTNGALDHIARFGAQFVNEADYYNGYNNNGRGETESYQAQHRLTRDVLDQMAKENLQAANELAERTGGKGKKINGKAIYDEKIRILKELRSELMKDVSSNEVALAGYNASIEAMKYLANEINDVTLRLYGVAKALQGSNYWPMQVIGRGNNLQFLNNNAFTMEEASYLQHRKGGSGALQINPFAEVMSSYIDRASKFVGFGELNSDLMMMSKEIGVGYGKHDSEKQSIQSTIQKQAGSSAAKWMTRYMETLNGTAKQPSKLGSVLRSSLASSSLSLNPGVALKQSPSYFNAAGIVDLDILIKNRLVTLGALRSAKSYDSNPLIQEINKRTGILESRKSGTVVLGEQDGRAMFGKLKKLLPDWITNRDVSTVSNLALACAEQVKRNNPGIDTKSDAFYEQTAKLLEQAVVKSQPVYDAEFRPDYLRSDNEVVRMLSMFRTQQSQNLNQLMQAYGELEAARREGGDVKAAERKRNQVVAGYAMSQVAFTVLSTAARALTHKTKDYEDEEGNIDLGKVAKRAGLDFLTTAGGVVWFGDVVSKAAIDIVSNLFTGGEGTSEFFSMSDNTISVIDDVIGSTIKVFQNPTPKTIKNEVFDLAQSVGLPARNFYNILNSAFMYGTDALRKNPGNYDDAIDMWMTESKKSDSTRAKDTTEAAVKAFKKGNAEKGNTLLATLDYSNKDVASAVKKAAGDAYVRGDIDEKTYRKILRDTAGAAAEAEAKAAEAALKAKEIDGKTYAEIVKNAGETDDDAINKAIHSKDIERTIAALTERDPKKYEALIKNINDAKENALTGTSKSNAAARLILDAAMSKEGQAAFMEKYTSSDYFKAYETASVGYKAEKVIEALANIDENKDDQFTQEELYAYFKDTGHSEIVRAVWRANRWKTSFDDYRKQKAKTAEYDKVAGENESYEFGEAEKKLKELKSGNTMHIQTGGGDPEMFKIIGGMGLSTKDTDTVVDKYVSSKTKTNYHVLRDNGYDPAKAMELLTAADTDGKGTLSQKELWAYYKSHKDDEAVIEALWNAQGYTGKNSKNWKTYKKKQK